MDSVQTESLLSTTSIVFIAAVTYV
jgi:hypothetical protein